MSLFNRIRIPLFILTLLCAGGITLHTLKAEATGYTPVSVNSPVNTSLKVTATPLELNNTTNMWVYKIDWKRTRNAQGSLSIAEELTPTTKVLSLSPASQEGSQTVTLKPSTTYRVKFYSTPGNGGTLILSKKMTTLSTSDEDPDIDDVYSESSHTSTDALQARIAELLVLIERLRGQIDIKRTTTQPSDPNMCSMEAKLCPDGKTYVSRTGPHCEFAPCTTVSKCDTGLLYMPSCSGVPVQNPTTCEITCQVPKIEPCPVFTPPPPGWCSGGMIVGGGMINGCMTPPRCMMLSPNPTVPIGTSTSTTAGTSTSTWGTISPGSTSTPVPTNNSIIINAPSPNSGSSGATITIPGVGFTSTGNTVKFQAISSWGNAIDYGYLPATVLGNNLVFVVPPISYSQRIDPGNYYISVVNSKGTSNRQSFTVNGSVDGGTHTNPVVDISTSDSLSLRQNVYARIAFVANATPSPSTIYTFSMTGTVPGMVFESIWCDRSASKPICPMLPSLPHIYYLDGVPTQAGSFPITITATDQNGNKGVKNFTITVVRDPLPPIVSTGLKDLGQARGIYIGSAVATEPLILDPEYPKVLKREFNLIMPENEMKMDTIQPTQGVFNFGPADTIVQFAKDNNMKVQGGPLVWAQQLPTWVRQGNFTPEQLREILRTHITTVITHFNQKFPGTVIQWEVANESIAGGGPWSAIGSDYVVQAFKWAKDADKTSNTSGTPAKMFYNDYANLYQVYYFVSNLKQQGAPIDAVGLQAHFNIMDYRTDMKTYFPQFASLGLEIYITELDSGITSQSAERLQAQATIYSDVAKICVTTPACKAIVTWGFTDKYSWIPSFFSGYGYALPFDANYQPKPAYTALQDALK